MNRPAVLLLGALIAGCYDSAHPCVEGLEHGGRYRITLGEALPSAPLHTGSVSCRDVKAFDALATGSVLEVTLPAGPWPANQYCQSPLADLDTDLGLMLMPIGNFGAFASGGQPTEELFTVNEMGVSDGCQVQWSLGATSTNGVAAFPEGIPGQDLFAVRSVEWFTLPGCPPPNPDGTFGCFDAWKIRFETVSP